MMMLAPFEAASSGARHSASPSLEHELYGMPTYAMEEFLVERGLMCRHCGHRPHWNKTCGAIYSSGPLYGHPCNCEAKR